MGVVILARVAGDAPSHHRRVIGDRVVADVGVPHIDQGDATPLAVRANSVDHLLLGGDVVPDLIAAQGHGIVIVEEHPAAGRATAPAAASAQRQVFDGGVPPHFVADDEGGGDTINVEAAPINIAPGGAGCGHRPGGHVADQVVVLHGEDVVGCRAAPYLDAASAGPRVRV